MKINSKKSKNKTLVIGLSSLGVVLALSAASFAYVYLFDGDLFGWKRSETQQVEVNYDPPTTEQVQAGQATKEEALGQDGKPKETDTANPATATITVTAAFQNGSVFQIRSLITPLTGSGTCTLTLTKGSSTLTKNADIQAQASSSTCRGFDIPVSELSAGEWNVVLTFEGKDSRGSTETKIEVE